MGLPPSALHFKVLHLIFLALSTPNDTCKQGRIWKKSLGEGQMLEARTCKREANIGGDPGPVKPGKGWIIGTL